MQKMDIYLTSGFSCHKVDSHILYESWKIIKMKNDCHSENIMMHMFQMKKCYLKENRTVIVKSKEVRRESNCNSHQNHQYSKKHLLLPTPTHFPIRQFLIGMFNMINNYFKWKVEMSQWRYRVGKTNQTIRQKSFTQIKNINIYLVSSVNSYVNNTFCMKKCYVWWKVNP